MKKYPKLGLIRSKGRLHKESNNSLRTPFQRDRDRIIHSSSFRRLKHKTQVFINTEGDHYRTRLTHSMEVAQIARTVARCFHLNDDLAETLSLAHDLGHTPFGHAGEDVLNECMINYGGFNHNFQTLRIIMFIENKYLNFNGLNLTIETLDGLLKHNGPIYNESNLNLIIGMKNFNNGINLSSKIRVFAPKLFSFSAKHNPMPPPPMIPHFLFNISTGLLNIFFLFKNETKFLLKYNISEIACSATSGPCIILPLVS